MIVQLVTTWERACGIAEHSAYLKAAVEAADPSITIQVVDILLPHAILQEAATADLVVLNYHAALHSQWTPDAIRQVQRERKIPVQVTYHDTGVPNSAQCLGIVAAADATVVHEPFDDLPIETVHYWRMGVPDWTWEWHFDRGTQNGWGRWPILGTIGFPFPWKNYEELARVTAALGWGLLLIAPTASPLQMAAYRSLNPHTEVLPYFVNRTEAVARLAACDATAFCYTCANTGQSAAILQGVAARKPVFAFPSCRQFRALYADPLGRRAIHWVDTFEDLGNSLSWGWLPIQRVDPPTVALAEQDGWPRLGIKYAQLWHQLVGARA